jgi:thiamine kinase-like enzyme
MSEIGEARDMSGQAEEQTDLSIEGVLDCIAPWKGRIKHYSQVGGGISNANWRVWIDGEPGSFFVKIPGRGTEMFIDRAVALEASHRAYSIGVGPKIHTYDTPPGVEVANFIEGRRTASNRDFLIPSVRASVVDVYRTLHASGPLSLTKTVFDMIYEHVSQIDQLSARMPDGVNAALLACRLARSRITAAGLDLVPSFNDPMPGNFLLDDANTLVLIDYEYASNNDRCYDLAAWSAEMFFSEAVEREIIELYFGYFDQRRFHRLQVYKAMADTKWALWAMVQNSVSALDFDFYKYGIWKLMRAQSVIDDPRWPTFIAEL